MAAENVSENAPLKQSLIRLKIQLICEVVQPMEKERFSVIEIWVFA